MTCTANAVRRSLHCSARRASREPSRDRARPGPGPLGRGPAHPLPYRGRGRPVGGRRLVHRPPRRDSRGGRGIRLRQVGDQPLHHGPHPLPAGRDRRRKGPVSGEGRQRRRAHRHGRSHHAGDPGQRHLDDLSGADDEPQPRVHDRRPDRGGDSAAPGQVPRGGEIARGGNAGAGRHRGPRQATDGIPPPALGGDAPAGDDRDGPVLQSDGAHRRRADHRPRRDDSGPAPSISCAPCSASRWRG